MTAARRIPAARALAALLALQGLLLAWSGLRNGVTYDEFAHLPAGVAYWRHGGFAIYNLSPPLARLLGSWPAALSGAAAPPVEAFAAASAGERHWLYGRAFQEANRARYHALFVAGRWAMIPVCLAGTLAVWAWARRLFGAPAALAGATLFALNPSFLAHGSIVGTDAATAAFVAMAGWAWTRLCDAPSGRRAMLAALAMTGATLCKFSALLIWPGTLLAGALLCRGDRRRARAAALAWAAAAGLTWAATLAIDGGRGAFRRLDSYAFVSESLRAWQHRLPGALPVPLPQVVVEGFDRQKREAEGLYEAFLLGSAYRGSRWDYYPVALAAKLPLGTIGVLTLAMVEAARRRRALPRGVAGAPAMAMALGAGLVLGTDINIGTRYLLPLLPLAAVWAALLWRADAAPRRIAWALLGLACVESLAHAPRWITFFNPVATALGGPRIVNDSDFDWGQSLPDLRRWMLEHGVREIALAYHGRVDPGVYGIAYEPMLRPPGPRFDYVAFSDVFLTGTARRMATPEGVSDFAVLPVWRALRDATPVHRAGSISVFGRAAVEAALARPAP